MVEKHSVANVAGGPVNTISNGETEDVARSTASLVISLRVEDADLVALRALN